MKLPLVSIGGCGWYAWHWNKCMVMKCTCVHHGLTGGDLFRYYRPTQKSPALSQSVSIRSLFSKKVSFVFGPSRTLFLFTGGQFQSQRVSMWYVVASSECGRDKSVLIRCDPLSIIVKLTAFDDNGPAGLKPEFSICDYVTHYTAGGNNIVRLSVQFASIWRPQLFSSRKRIHRFVN